MEMEKSERRIEGRRERTSRKGEGRKENRKDARWALSKTIGTDPVEPSLDELTKRWNGIVARTGILTCW